MSTPKKFLIFTQYGEICDLIPRLESEGHKVLLHISDPDYQKIYEGMATKLKEWYRAIGKGYIWVFDGCENGDMQDYLRERGELVVGGSKIGDKMENDRQLGQAIFKKAGFAQPESHNFKSIDDALKFVSENSNKKWILKQNGDAPKSINHMTKFDGCIDMLYHLESLKKRWNTSEYGEVNFDLMEQVEGQEIAVSAFWNGSDWLRDSAGKAVAYANWEHKRQLDGNLGETTGETGTLFKGIDGDSKLFKLVLDHPEITDVLKRAKFKGVFDINGSILKDGRFCAFEPTSRFGIPATSYEFIEGLQSNCGDLLESMAKGTQTSVKLNKDWGMAIVIYAKPFPVEADLDDEATSIGERLWIINNGKPIADFTPEQRKHIHLENFYKDEGNYFVATKNGYLGVCTGTGKDIKSCRENLLKYIKDNIYISGIGYRQDIGKRVEELKNPGT